ncbi:MAG: group I truncated hemoglobin [Segniliparus sp.]|uniref:group I truncated hemoglobin n=1 Tax=Segniliparus sp. TaxID=2804064 RepID=UPI003F2BDE43
MPTVYEQIGGAEALEEIVELFYQKVLADESLAGFFTGMDMGRLKGRQVEFFATVLGGPRPYAGTSLRQVHQGRGILAHHFSAAAGHLALALVESGMTGEAVDEIIGAVAPFVDDIVSKSVIVSKSA